MYYLRLLALQVLSCFWIQQWKIISQVQVFLLKRSILNHDLIFFASSKRIKLVFPILLLVWIIKQLRQVNYLFIFYDEMLYDRDFLKLQIFS